MGSFSLFANGYERLNNKALFSTDNINNISKNFFTSLNNKSLRKHAIDIKTNSRIIQSDGLFLTETQLADADKVTNDFSIVFNNSNFHCSSLAIVY